MRDRPLRILHLTAGSDAGGLSRYIHDLSTAMIAQGHEVIVAGEKGAWHELFEKSPIQWIEVSLKGGPIALRKSAQMIREWLRSHPRMPEVDVIHTHYRRPTLAARTLQKLLSKALGIYSAKDDKIIPVYAPRRRPVIYTVHLSDLKLSIPWRWFTDFGDYTHVASQEARRWAIEQGHVAADRVTLIPHGIDVSKFSLQDDSSRRSARRALNLPDDARIAAYVGRLDYPKNVDWLIGIAQKIPALHLLIAGEGPDEPALKSQIQQRNLVDRVYLLGHRQPLQVYHAADALLLPSLREGFSLVCAEAMCAGIPVLRTRTAGTSELIIENQTGRSTPIDRDEFVRAAIEFLSLPDSELARMGAVGAEHIRRNFTFEIQLQQTLALYRRIVTLSSG